MKTGCDLAEHSKEGCGARNGCLACDNDKILQESNSSDTIAKCSVCAVLAVLIHQLPQ
jgi:hypothetical protein